MLGFQIMSDNIVKLMILAISNLPICALADDAPPSTFLLKDLQKDLITISLSDPLTPIDTSGTPKYISVLVSPKGLKSLPVVQDPWGGNGIGEIIPTLISERACMLGYRSWYTSSQIEPFSQKIIRSQTFSHDQAVIITVLDENKKEMLIECPADFTVAEFRNLLNLWTNKDSAKIEYAHIEIYGGIIRNRKSGEYIAAAYSDSQFKIILFTPETETEKSHVKKIITTIDMNPTKTQQWVEHIEKINSDSNSKPTIPFGLGIDDFPLYSGVYSLTEELLIIGLYGYLYGLPLLATPFTFVAETALIPVAGTGYVVDHVITAIQNRHIQRGINTILNPAKKGKSVTLGEKRFNLLAF